MPDIYATISEQPVDVQQRVIQALNLRADEPEMQGMLNDYLADIEVPTNAHVLEIGCGAGAATRKLSGLPNVSHVTATDLSPHLLARARELSKNLDNVTFAEADARSLEFEDDSFDIVVSHTVLCHVPEPQEALREAFRVLKPSGQIVVFDSDYATMNIATGDFDPLQSCVDAVLSNFVHDIWFMRRLPKMVQAAGFIESRTKGHGYVKISDPKYLLTVVDRGADAIATEGIIGTEMAAALKAEARRRVEEQQFYGVVMFGSLIAKKGP